VLPAQPALPVVDPTERRLVRLKPLDVHRDGGDARHGGLDQPWQQVILAFKHGGFVDGSTVPAYGSDGHVASDGHDVL